MGGQLRGKGVSRGLSEERAGVGQALEQDLSAEPG